MCVGHAVSTFCTFSIKCAPDFDNCKLELEDHLDLASQSEAKHMFSINF